MAKSKRASHGPLLSPKVYHYTHDGITVRIQYGPHTDPSDRFGGRHPQGHLDVPETPPVFTPRDSLEGPIIASKGYSKGPIHVIIRAGPPKNIWGTTPSGDLANKYTLMGADVRTFTSYLLATVDLHRGFFRTLNCQFDPFSSSQHLNPPRSRHPDVSGASLGRRVTTTSSSSAQGTPILRFNTMARHPQTFPRKTTSQTLSATRTSWMQTK